MYWAFLIGWYTVERSCISEGFFSRKQFDYHALICNLMHQILSVRKINDFHDDQKNLSCENLSNKTMGEWSY